MIIINTTLLTVFGPVSVSKVHKETCDFTLLTTGYEIKKPPFLVNRRGEIEEFDTSFLSGDLTTRSLRRYHDGNPTRLRVPPVLTLSFPSATGHVQDRTSQEDDGTFYDRHR